MNCLRIWLFSLAAFCMQACDLGAETLVPNRPNILFILVDDLGWSDLGCYGHPWHRTPHIDSLATDGVRFTNAYAPAPICSASRASILTGKTAARLGFEFVTKHQPGLQTLDSVQPLQPPPITLDLPLAETTFAERLLPLGYETAFFGKWHVSRHFDGAYQAWHPEFGPTRQGFQVAHEDFGDHPYAWPKKQKKKPEPIKPGQFPHDSMVQNVVDYLHRDHGRPFLAVASSFYVHTPVKNRTRWLVDQYDKLVPEDVANRSRRLEYAAFLETLDHHVGKILQAIDDSGQRDNTMVVFLSDNGGHPEFTGNAPLRGSKWNLYEGGIRVPMMVRSPDVLKPGSTCNTPTIGYDLAATFADIAGDNLDRWSEETDGRSILPELTGRPPQEPRNLVWHFPYYHPETNFSKAIPRIGVDDFAVSQTRPQSALRRGRYKALHFAESDRVEVYDMETDISEQHDLSKTQPELASELRQTLFSGLKGMNARQAQPKNVLFIAVDDMRVELGCYGATHVKSPNLDSLAKRSLVFDRAYCQQSVCNPSRASIMTGLDIDTLGIYNLQIHFREVFPDIVTLPQLFKNNGYQTHGIGKLFHNYRQKLEGDARSWDSPQLLHYGNHNADFAEVDGERPEDMVPIPRAEKLDVPDNAYLDGRIAELAVDRLREIKDKPFFLAVGFWKPHLPFNAPAKYWDMYDRNDLALPSNPEPPKNVPAIALHRGRELIRDYDEGLKQSDTLTLRHGYYAAISYVDAQIGKLLDELDRLGLRDQTIVVFWSDHGFHLGEHDLWCKNSCFELDARVPMMIRVPGMTDDSPRTEALVELVDVYPTLADLCGLPTAQQLDGVSLRPVIENPKATVRQFAMNQNPRPIIPKDPKDIEAMGYSIRSKNFRYTRWQKPVDGSVVATELYDHQTDPMETQNLAGEKAYAKVQAQHGKWLDSRLK